MSNNKQAQLLNGYWVVETNKWDAYTYTQEQAQQYAEFCIRCRMENLPLLEFNSWIAHNETFNNEQTN